MIKCSLNIQFRVFQRNATLFGYSSFAMIPFCKQKFFNSVKDSLSENSFVSKVLITTILKEKMIQKMLDYKVKNQTIRNFLKKFEIFKKVKRENILKTFEHRK